ADLRRVRLHDVAVGRRPLPLARAGAGGVPHAGAVPDQHPGPDVGRRRLAAAVHDLLLLPAAAADPGARLERHLPPEERRDAVVAGADAAGPLGRGGAGLPDGPAHPDAPRPASPLVGPSFWCPLAGRPGAT